MKKRKIKKVLISEKAFDLFLKIGNKRKNVHRLSRETGVTYSYAFYLIKTFYREKLVEREKEGRQWLVSYSLKGKKVLPHLVWVKNWVDKH
jgi:DNA-binding MarR family transcriptional regulator